MQISHYKNEIFNEEQKIKDLFQNFNNVESFENWFAYLDLSLIILSYLNPNEKIDNLKDYPIRVNSTDKMFFMQF